MNKFRSWAIYGLVLTLGIAPTAIDIVPKENISITVEDKERISNRSSDSSKYLIFTKNEVFENTDELFYLKFNSSDIYGQLKQGQTYNVTVVGIRIPFFSRYRNIININP